MAFQKKNYNSKEIDFFKFFKFSGKFFLFLTLVLSTIIFIFGINFDIDFVGGSRIDIQTKNDRDNILNDLREKYSLEDNTKNSDSSLSVIVKGFVDYSDVQEIVSAYEDSTLSLVDFFGPQLSFVLLKKAIIAFLVSLLLVFIYVSFRFDGAFAIGCMIAILHDVLFTIAFISILQIQFNFLSVTALLTIIGYSVNDTIIVFNSIRKNLEIQKEKKHLKDIINKSLNSIISRVLITSITTIVSLCALAIFGGSYFLSFSIVLIWGCFIGTLSSIFISTSFLVHPRVRSFLYQHYQAKEEQKKSPENYL